jgi:hypothetical protein
MEIFRPRVTKTNRAEPVLRALDRKQLINNSIGAAKMP